MRYYKLINGKVFVGVGTSHDLRRFQFKHKIFLCCDEKYAQYIQCGDKFYHAEWMKPETIENSRYDTIDIIEITKEEYDTLYKAVETGEEIQIEQEIEEPDTPYVDPSDEITIEYITSQKIAEMSNNCNKAILSGFDVILSDGKNYHFSLTNYDQMMISKLADKAESGETFLPWHYDGGDCMIFSKDDIQIINNKMEQVITYHLTYFNSLRKYILSLDNIEDISKVAYGMEIPTEYQTEVLQILLQQTVNEL